MGCAASKADCKENPPFDDNDIGDMDDIYLTNDIDLEAKRRIVKNFSPTKFSFFTSSRKGESFNQTECIEEQVIRDHGSDNIGNLTDIYSPGKSSGATVTKSEFPSPAWVIKTWNDRKDKVFINVCGHDSVIKCSSFDSPMVI
jgi:hypothetical protein